MERILFSSSWYVIFNQTVCNCDIFTYLFQGFRVFDSLYLLGLYQSLRHPLADIGNVIDRVLYGLHTASQIGIDAYRQTTITIVVLLWGTMWVDKYPFFYTKSLVSDLKQGFHITKLKSHWNTWVAGDQRESRWSMTRCFGKIAITVQCFPMFTGTRITRVCKHGSWNASRFTLVRGIFVFAIVA